MIKLFFATLFGAGATVLWYTGATAGDNDNARGLAQMLYFPAFMLTLIDIPLWVWYFKG